MMGTLTRVYVEGRIHTNRWEDAETGEQRSGVEIVIHELIMLGGRGTTPVEDTDHMGTPAPASRVHVARRQRASVTPLDDLPL